MKKLIVIFVLFASLFLPFLANADCSNSGTTVIFVNGMFVQSRVGADRAKNDLELKYQEYGRYADVKFITGYNESHVGGLADAVDASVQAYVGGYMDYDLTNILRQVHGDLKTQKIILVGHSQGTFYTNAAYDYLVTNGVNRNSISVYNIGTPADRVAGNGQYLNSSTDKVINEIAKKLTQIGFARQPLEPNIDLKLSEADKKNPAGGHGFGETYLAQAADRIIGEIDKQINSLKAGNSDESQCFKEPKEGTIYIIQNTGYSIANGIAKNSKYFATSPFIPSQLASLLSSFFNKIYDTGNGAWKGVAKLFRKADLAGSLSTALPVNNILQKFKPPTEPVQEATFSEYNGTGGLDLNPTTPQGVQDLLDEIQERLDEISQQVQNLVNQQQGNNQNNPGNVSNNTSGAGTGSNSGAGGSGGNGGSGSGGNGSNNGGTGGNSGGGGGIVDTTAPVITLTGAGVITVTVGNSYFDQGATALDNIDGNVTQNIIVVNPVNTNVVGDYTVTYNVSDLAGNHAVQATRLVHVVAVLQPPEEPVLANPIISEVQIATAANVNDDWVELYNPNNADFSLKGWSIQKSGWGSGGCSVDTSFYSKHFDDTAVIPAKGFYLIVSTRASDALLALATGTSAMTIGWSLTDDNTIYLVKNTDKITDYNDADIVDRVGYGENACSSETNQATAPLVNLSIGRKVVGGAREQDTNNNSADFELNNPTPKAQNTTYVAPPSVTLVGIAITTPATKLSYNVGDSLDISGLAVTGTYSDTSTKAETITLANISGFNSSTPATGQILTITVSGKTTTYAVNINAISGGSDLPSITTYTIDNAIISPNGDGIKDTASIDLAFSETVSVDFDVLNSSGVDIRDLYTSSGVKNPSTKVWDGKNNSGAIVANGVYTLSAHIVDSDNNSLTDTSKTITVEGVATPPTASSDATVSSLIYTIGAEVAGSASISGIWQGLTKTDFLANVAKNQANQTWDLSGLHDLLLDGDTLVVTAEDGTTKITYTITVTPNITPTIWSRGVISYFTDEGKFYFNTTDFMPNSHFWCGIWVGQFKGAYPNMTDGAFFGTTQCDQAYPYYPMEMAQFATVGEHDFYINYCGGSYDEYMNNNCGGRAYRNDIGDYYRTYFDGTKWYPLSGSDITIKFSSAAYTSNGLDITVPFGTLKSDFLPALILPAGASIDTSNISDLILNAQNFTIVSQDRSTTAVYTIHVSADPLPPAKELAHNALTIALANYTETDYTPENWILLNRYKTDGDTAIDLATNIVDVALAKTTATNAMAGVAKILP